jgi:hypothetical protein
MKVADMVDFVCRKVGQTDEQSREACREFVVARYRMLWDRALWRESKTAFSVSVAAGTAEVELPSDPKLESVLALRWGDRQELAHIDRETLLRMDPEAWHKEGEPLAWENAGAGGETGNLRVRLFQRPREGGTLLVFGKLALRKEVGDEEEPVLTGATTALLAFAEGDMLERKRQYAKAQLKFSEAQSHVETMIDNEMRQAGAGARIIPDTDPGWRTEDWLV